MLILQPIGGICNRMRSINSALVLAKKRGERLTVIWNVNSELGCPFEELFEKTDAFDVRNIKSKFDPVKMYYQLSCSRIGNDDIRKNRTEAGLPDEYCSQLASRLYIATEEHFFPNHDYSVFVPMSAIKSRVEKIRSLYGQYCVGVHIRRTDSVPSIEKSSTDAFVSSIKRELDSRPEAMFYLATDDMSEEKKLRELFPGKIISNEDRDLSRSSVAGIHDAMLDLLCLSETNKIIGSYNSSFTDIAADFRGIPKEVAGMEESL